MRICSPRLRRLWPFARLRRDERGSPAIEFAFVAPVLFLMVVGTMELGMVLFVNILMEAGLRDAARYGVTGQVPPTGSRESYIIEIVGRRTIGLVDMDKAHIHIITYPTFGDVGRGEEFVDGNGNGGYDAGETYTDENGNGQYDDDVGQEGAGGSGQVVVYRIDYDWPIMTPLAAPVIGENGVFPLRASVAVRNEPWEPGTSS